MCDIIMESKVVLITGASAGIGKGIAKKFSKHGASLVLSGRNSENLNAVAKECFDLGAKEIHAVIANFENISDVKNLLDEAIKKFGRLDVLVNNVGVKKPSVLADVKLEDFDWTFNINVKATLYLTQLAMPFLEKVKGNVVNVSSLASSVQSPMAIVYRISKAAIDQFTRTVALEYAPKDVRVNAVNPAYVNTGNYSKRSGWDEKKTADFFDAIVAKHPLGRLGTPEDIASAVFMLASDSSSWITGQCLKIDGGYSIKSQ